MHGNPVMPFLEWAMSKNKRRKRRANYARMTMFSDCLMYHVFHNAPDVVEHMLRIILGFPLHVTSANVEYAIKFGTGTGIRMDVHAIDDAGAHYDVEIQKNEAGATLERADYYGSAMKVYFSKRKTSKRIVPKTYVIFITATGRNCHKRAFYRYALKGENGEETGVGTQIIFVNGLWRDNSDLGRMMHDFGCANPKKMKDDVFAKRVAYVKSNRNVRGEMDEYEARKYRKAKKTGYKQGIKIGEANIASRMLQSGSFSDAQILDATGLTAKQLDQIKRTQADAKS